MGHTHYHTINSDEKIRKDILQQIKELIKENYPKKIQLEADDNSKPVVNEEEIIFNGIGEDAHETFLFSLKSNYRFSCTKTNLKPYNEVVVETLLLLKENYKEKLDLSSDGLYVREDEFIRGEIPKEFKDIIEKLKSKYGYEYDLIPTVSGENEYWYFSYQFEREQKEDFQMIKKWILQKLEKAKRSSDWYSEKIKEEKNLKLKESIKEERHNQIEILRELAYFITQNKNKKYYSEEEKNDFLELEKIIKQELNKVD